MSDLSIQARRHVDQFELEDVLNESMADFEDNPVYDTIIRWVCRFPQYADEIFDYVECVIIMQGRR